MYCDVFQTIGFDPACAPEVYLDGVANLKKQVEGVYDIQGAAWECFRRVTTVREHLKDERRRRAAATGWEERLREEPWRLDHTHSVVGDTAVHDHEVSVPVQSHGTEGNHHYLELQGQGTRDWPLVYCHEETEVHQLLMARHGLCTP